MTSSFSRFIAWGHPLHSHSHSYIHAAFIKAFESMGVCSMWREGFGNYQEWADEYLPNSLVLTEGQVDSRLPLDKRATYILHNCDQSKYKAAGVNYVNLQVYTHDCRKRGVELAPFCRWDASDRTLYQSWGTDLLPHEIDALIDQPLPRDLARPYCPYVGFVARDPNDKFGNADACAGFERACRENGVEFRVMSHVNDADHMAAIRGAFLAPALVGPWQQEKGYLPCRIFKNISYGHLGLTNSEAVKELFGDHVFYCRDTHALFNDGKMHWVSENLSYFYGEAEIKRSMRYVRDNHTYVSRVKTILECLGK